MMRLRSAKLLVAREPMTPNTDKSLGELHQRLDRLERENRSLKRGGWFLLVALAAIFLMGQAAPRAPLKVVEAERFILTGRSGKPRAVLAEGSDGNVGLRFLGATTDVVRMAMAVERNGAPSLELSDSNGKRRIGMAVSTDGSVTFGILDAAEKDRAGLGLASDGTIGFTLLDPDNNRRLFLGVSSDGTPLMGLHGKTKGDSRVIAIAKENVPPQLVLFDRAGNVIWKAP